MPPTLSIWRSVEPGLSVPETRARFRHLADLGFGRVFLGGGIDEATFDAVREAGLELHAWMWTTNRPEPALRERHPDWFMVSRSGRSCATDPPYVDYYRWLSPVVPGVQAYLAERTEELASHPAVQGVHFDYVRYPDVVLPRALWETYGLDQREELPDFDFCYSPASLAAFAEEYGRAPGPDPTIDQDWIHWRYATVSRLVDRLVGVVHQNGRVASAAVFPTPRLARQICRQDWGAWPLDFVCPMLYHSFYSEPAEWVEDRMRENVQSTRIPIVAGLYLPAFTRVEELAWTTAQAGRRGAVGVSLFGDLPEGFDPRVADAAR